MNIKEFLEKAIMPDLLSLVSRSKRDKLERFRVKGECQRSLAAELLIRTVIAERMQLRNRDIRFEYNVYGKPFLMDYALDFNLSHSGHWVVCAIDETPIGIDVEEIKPISPEIAQRYFSYSEYRRLVQLSDSDKLDYFYSLWTLKESYIKNVGIGLSIPLNLISFNVDGENISFENKHSCENREFKQYPIEGSYKLSVCSCSNNFPERIVVNSFEQLMLKCFEVLKE